MDIFVLYWIIFIFTAIFKQVQFFMFIFIKYGNTVSMNGGKLECAD